MQRIWDLMQPLSFENKQFRIKEESQRLIIRTLNEYVFFLKEKRAFINIPINILLNVKEYEM